MTIEWVDLDDAVALASDRRGQGRQDRASACSWPARSLSD